MEYKFVGGGQDGRKRKAPYAACTPCKRRKKRCAHVPHAVNDGPSIDQTGKTSNEHIEGDPSVRVKPTRHAFHDDRPRSSIFLGETHPAVGLNSLREGVASSRSDCHGVGTWIDDDIVTSRATGPSDREQDRLKLSADVDVSRRDARLAYVLPRVEQQRILLDIFRARIQPLLPILDDDDDENIMPPMLMQAVCLAACKDDQASECLILEGKSLAAISFSEQLYCDADSKVRTLRSSELDRIRLIQTHLLLSLHCQEPQDAEKSSLHLGIAVHHSQSIGLHLGQSSVAKPRGHAAGAEGSKTQHHRSRLFWCVWSLDRLNSAINGRPRMLFKDDIGLDLDETLHVFTPTAQLWMLQSQLLDRVIELYSPHATTDREQQLNPFPTFEELLEEVEGGNRQVEPTLLATLEFFYLAIAMVSCRVRLQAGRSLGSHLYLRRSLSATTICSMLGHTGLEDVAPLPIVPYAVSLAQLVAYQQMRQSKREARRAIAREQLEQCQKRLESMGPVWWSAREMAEIGKRVLTQLAHKNPTQQPIPPATRAHEETLRVYEQDRSSIGGATDEQDAPMAGAQGANSNMADDDGSIVGTRGDPVQDPSGEAFIMDDNAFADMDAIFGNLMDMNAFPDSFDFVFQDGFGDVGVDDADNTALYAG